MIVRGPRPADNFAQIHNAALADGELSFKARGILAYLLSRPPGWQTSAERLARSGRDGDRAIKSGLKELEERGYLKRSKKHKPDGTWEWTQVITDQPELDTVSAKQPDGENQVDTVDTVGAFCTGGKQPDINNTLPNNTSTSGDVVNPPSVTDAHTPLSRDPLLVREGAGPRVGGPTPASRLWTPSAAALKTAHEQVELMDVQLSIARYAVVKAEKRQEPSSSEWLRWLIADEQKLRLEEKERAKTNGDKKSWWAVAGD